MTITTEDRAALLKEGVLVHSVHHYETHPTQLFVTAPDEEHALEAVSARLGAAVDVNVCGDAPREVRPRRCTGHMEREAGRLQLRYDMQRDEHMDEILVAEDDERVVVFATVCTPIDPQLGDVVGCPYHVHLDRPLGERVVFDAVARAPVPYFNVYDGIWDRVEAQRAASDRTG
ncbi:hypothetical protein C8N24_3234 [Solirubrobacter pauli]|uniref:Uncharacterized protein n=1 Tax=Solirubrobacter pauli TaxID=166793 RepID=A0A660LJS5_9ACTN|nr:hypothetical protein [Solirubrobacter pauli]RKQ93371.1 hypothetical protein C8N24_3234 [Solirubrobacter pauli]